MRTTAVGSLASLAPLASLLLVAGCSCAPESHTPSDAAIDAPVRPSDSGHNAAPVPKNAGLDAPMPDAPPPRCGDGVIDEGEQCDDGDANSDTAADACRTSCATPSCGDSVVDTGEACDDGDANSDTAADACRTACAAPSCGDGVVDTGETCEPGGATACTATCTAAGTGTWDPTTAGADVTLSDGNLTISGTNGFCARDGVLGLRSASSGRWYFEHGATRDGGSSDTDCPVAIGIESADGSTRVAWYGFHGAMTTLSEGSYSCTGAGPFPVDTGEVMGVAWDADAGTVQFTLNGAPTFSCTVPPGTYFPYGGHCNDAVHHCAGTTNFGATPFEFGPPTGYVPLP